ncbi:ZIP zinc transporter-domain-containing protein [Boletus edulis BED1]|uniref:ZIP zinc transporter-domain-containing protein n=1 Tax=Boletus edulis BED1 TaxID=1328754 RepID=A0AAD4BVE2_BOLED|nr:ZIP zinc transporter-domain-containing protein [Boletus edulis BED1]
MGAPRGHTILFVTLLLCVALTTRTVLCSEQSELVIRESDIHDCAAVQKLNHLKHVVEDDQSPIMRQVFAWLFPFGPGWNAVLGTFYISSVPNFILAFIPAEIDTNTLNTMTAFATGGLLSDVFLHLVPHAFLGEHQDSGAHFVMVEDKRNILIGLAIFIGFATFFIMEKSLRVLGGDQGNEGHSHGHSHSHSHVNTSADAIASGVSITPEANGLRSRGEEKRRENGHSKEVDLVQGTGPSKLSAYLNLFGDFVHNITDGLAMAASFYSSPLIGATTTLACFAHEIPHEIADYSILVRSGFSKRQAMQSQFLTAIGAFVGTFMGIAIHNLSATGTEPVSMDLAAGVRQDASGIFGTTVQPADLVIPFVAGGFLYIGAVAVLPTLLAESKSGAQALREFGAMAFGVLCMFLVAWNE